LFVDLVFLRAAIVPQVPQFFPGFEALRRNSVPRPPPGITLRFGWGAESPSISWFMVKGE
jgi:hypothetical protein